MAKIVNEIAQYEIPCRYRDGNMYCSSGHIYVMEPESTMAALALMEEAPLKCPCCKGSGHILTTEGEQLVEMMWRHLERRIADLIQEIKPLD
jgi:hypothetical protein